MKKMKTTKKNYIHYKTIVMKYVKTNKRRMNTRLQRIKLEVEEFCYLGSMTKKDNHSKCDEKNSIIQANKPFAKKIQLLTSSMDIEIRKCFHKTYVWSVAL